VPQAAVLRRPLDGLAGEALQRAVVAAVLHVHRQRRHAVAARVLEQGVRRVEAHGLRVEQRADERRRVVALEVARGVGDERERGGVRLGEAVVGEALELLEDALALLAGEAQPAQADQEALLELGELLGGALVAHGPAQRVGLAQREAGAATARRITCSWKRVTPSVRARMGSKTGCG
jgi:hypothetical protein